MVFLFPYFFRCMIMSGLPSSLYDDDDDIFNDCIISMLEEDFTVKKDSIASITRLLKGEDEVSLVLHSHIAFSRVHSRVYLFHHGSVVDDAIVIIPHIDLILSTLTCLYSSDRNSGQLGSMMGTVLATTDVIIIHLLILSFCLICEIAYKT